MIVPMTKYTFLIHHADYKPFLEQLQELGVVDVADKGVEPDELTTSRILKLQQTDRLIKFLKTREQQQTPEQTELSPDDILNTIAGMQAEHESIRQKINVSDKAFRSLRPWGAFAVEQLSKLKEAGFTIRFFTITEKKFDPEWEKQYYLQEINRTEGLVFFVVVQRPNESLNIDADEVKSLDRSVKEVLAEKEELENRKAEIEAYYAENARAFVPKLEQLKTQLDNSISFERVVQNTGKEADDRLMIVEGWVPEMKTEAVNDFLAKQELYYITEKPTREDSVPVLLKNNKFSRLFEPIAKLYALPSYTEMDLVPFFAPFFMLFFGFCLGDAGYGVLFLLVTTIIKSRVATEHRPIVALAQWLGASTVLFGVLTGTFFGIDVIELIDKGRITWLDNVRAYMLDSEKLFNAALLLGAIQIVYAMVIKAVNQARQFGLPYALSTIGWLLLIAGVLLFTLVKSESNAAVVSIISYVIFAVSGVLILFMNTPGKNIFLNFGIGLWNTYNMVTGVLGDLLSYIRLFALGVSSAILGYVFNDLAMQMSGNLPVVSQVVFLLIILVGHGLNIFMASIGAFVHPMRLTFLEFYKNAGFEGGGKAYAPFIKK